MRADRPIGVWLLLWPCLWSIAMASHFLASTTTIPDLWAIGLIPSPEMIILFALGAFIMRGAGCTLNDIVDRDFDAAVARTQARPLPSGRISRRQAMLFMIGLCLLGLVILLQFNTYTVFLGVSSLALIIIYPFMKRITYWPQAWLGLTFNWGVLMGWSAVTGTLNLPAFCLYAAGWCWTMGYDTIYAHQDKEDDMIVGVKSTALRFGDHTKHWLCGFYSLQIVLFTMTGLLVNMPSLYFIGLIFCAAHLIWQIKTLDIQAPDNCLMLFKANHGFGALYFLVILLGHYAS
tara:strand:+ start:1990 stop:2859 length:870 start_codon:yes stop_codon:yes gene_type:complete